ncbi:MAG: hypothetical protein R2831_08455 [Chitinophagaceae bacterium]
MRYVLVAVILLPLFCQAGKKNKLRMDIDMMQVADHIYSKDFAQWGLTYQRQVCKKYYLGLTYHKWTTENDNFLPEKEGNLIHKRWLYDWDGDIEGLISNRQYYRHVGLEGNRIIFDKAKRGMLCAGMGISYTWGRNSVVDTVLRPQVEPFDAYDIKYSHHAARYFGICPTINYDYFLWKERIILGVHLKARKMFGMPQMQYDAGFHFGYQF